MHRDDHDHGETVDWDERYAGDGSPLWSGRPNGTLVAEITGMPPGRALEVGCGEGADAIWLALQGWRVIAVDPSRVALDRAAAAAAEAGVDVTWLHAELTTMPRGAGSHDLVSAQYLAMRRTEDAVAALLGAVAPGGTLLFVHHAGFPTYAGDHGIDPTAYVRPGDVLAALDDGWQVQTHEVRPRPAPVPPGGSHSEDEVLRVRRRGRAER